MKAHNGWNVEYVIRKEAAAVHGSWPHSLKFQVRILKCIDNEKPLRDCRKRGMVRFPLQKFPQLDRWTGGVSLEVERRSQWSWWEMLSWGTTPLNPQDPWSLLIEQWLPWGGGGSCILHSLSCVSLCSGNLWTRKELGLGSALPFTSSGAWAKSLPFSVPQLTHLRSGDDNPFKDCQGIPCAASRGQCHAEYWAEGWVPSRGHQRQHQEDKESHSSSQKWPRRMWKSLFLSGTTKWCVRSQNLRHSKL